MALLRMLAFKPAGLRAASSVPARDAGRAPVQAPAAPASGAVRSVGAGSGLPPMPKPVGSPPGITSGAGFPGGADSTPPDDETPPWGESPAS